MTAAQLNLSAHFSSGSLLGFSSPWHRHRNESIDNQADHNAIKFPGTTTNSQEIVPRAPANAAASNADGPAPNTFRAIVNGTLLSHNESIEYMRTDNRQRFESAILSNGSVYYVNGSHIPTSQLEPASFHPDTTSANDQAANHFPYRMPLQLLLAFSIPGKHARSVTPH